MLVTRRAGGVRAMSFTGGVQGFGALPETGEMINDRYVVQQRLGDGTFSTVYQVFDSKLKLVRALKIFKDGTSTDDRLVAEFRTLENLNHPAIGRVFHADQIHDTPTWFLILEYLPGPTLTKLIRERKLSIQQSVAIARQVLAGLDHVHHHGLYHRDVKPNNIIVTADGAKLIDFNIARPADDPRMHYTGTPPYMAPDIYDPNWDWSAHGASADTYGLGVCLYQMLTGEYPFAAGGPSLWATVPDPQEANPRLSRGLADVAMRSVRARAADRFPSAPAMLAALDVVESFEVQPEPSTQELDWESLGISEEDLSVPGQNPILTRFLSLYSQSKVTNAGTRGLDSFTRLIYVPTRIDRELTPAIKRGEFRLVIITGNAGDGKTAFIQMLESEVERHANVVEHDPSGNGARFELAGRRFVTNYDGSQDEGDVTNDAVLEEFFAPFQGHQWDEAIGDETRIIAINEGRLVDFLLSHRRDYLALYEQVTRFFNEDREPNTGLAIVNLNLRAVTAGAPEDPSIFDRLLDRFTAPVFWERCAGCDLADRCYVNFNVRSMRDPIYGEQVRDRLRRFFTVAHYRGQLHLTIRDLRSALAYILFGTRDCAEIRAMAGNPEQRRTYLGYFYYNAPFADSAANAQLGAMECSGDRLIGLLSQADVAEVANPRLDAELNGMPPMRQPHFPDFEDRPPSDLPLLQELYEARSGGGGAPTAEGGEAGRAFHAFARRKAAFERRADTVEMLPFTTFQRFDGLATRKIPDVRPIRGLVADALSASEGIHHDRLRDGYVCLQVGTERKATIKSIRRFPIAEFKVEVPPFERLTRFVEYLPTSFAFVHGREGAVRLDVNLDLFEMLDRIKRGFTPSIEELRGPFVNILIFKRQLHSLRYDELLLTPDEQSFYLVTKHPDQTLELCRFDLD